MPKSLGVEREECRIALVTAQVWVATAKYRDDAERLLNYRDSLLAANGLSKEQMFEYVQRSKGESEGLLPFTQRLRELVDSLARIEDSLLKGTPEPVIDSVSAADSAQAER